MWNSRHRWKINSIVSKTAKKDGWKFSPRSMVRSKSLWTRPKKKCATSRRRVFRPTSYVLKTARPWLSNGAVTGNSWRALTIPTAKARRSSRRKPTDQLKCAKSKRPKRNAKNAQARWWSSSAASENFSRARRILKCKND